MDAHDSSVIDVPKMRLAKVGRDRERKRGGAGWFGGRGAGSGLRGAFGGIGGGAEAGAGGFFGAGGAGGIFAGDFFAGNFMGTGMSLGKLLLALLLGGGASVGAWEIGNSLAASSRGDDKSAGARIFADKGAQKYGDTSGVIKQDSSIPNSLGYVNNDGLTDEQRAAKKAAEDAAAAKAAADAQRLAAEEAQRQAAEAGKALPAPDSDAAGAMRGMQGIQLGPMSPLFGAGMGGGGAGGGSPASASVNSGGAGMGGGNKGKSGALAAFHSPAEAASARAAVAAHPKTTAQGFAGRQLELANGLSRQAAVAGKNETSAASAAVPFDNNPNQGAALSGAGDGSGPQPGSSPYGSGLPNMPSGGGQSTTQSSAPNGIPIASGGGGGGGGGAAACSVSGDVRNSSGNCEPSTPKAKDAAPYQSLLDKVPPLLAIITGLFASVWILSKMTSPWAFIAAKIAVGLIALAGAALAVIGGVIATMKGGDPIIGTILSISGVGVAGFALWSLMGPAPVTGAKAVSMLAKSLISTAFAGIADAAKHMSGVGAMM